jgi:hypothetical protein
MRVRKEHSPSRKPIKIRRLRLWMTVERTYPVVEVIDRDEQYD